MLLGVLKRVMWMHLVSEACSVKAIWLEMQKEVNLKVRLSSLSQDFSFVPQWWNELATVIRS